MAEPQDWIDRALAQGAWEPPAGFTNRIVLQTMAILPRRLSLRERLVAVATGLLESARARIEGSAWVLRQYREMIFGSG